MPQGSKPPASLRSQRRQAGKSARTAAPRSAHAAWIIAKPGRDPLPLLLANDAGRVPELLPIRYGRMLQSPFAFLRGSAAVMAYDLSRTPVSGIRVQACGDCHLLNFGAFATPERNVIFDVNDFDETLPAPWEWDVKRLAASVMVAGRYRGFSDSDSADAVSATVRSYRDHIAEYAQWPPLDIWYARIDAAQVVEIINQSKTARGSEAIAAMSPATTSGHLLPKLAEVVDGHLRIKDNPPLAFHPPKAAAYGAHVRRSFGRYRDSLAPERRLLLSNYRLVDVAMKVVGVGSVGTRVAVALLQADVDQPLFLQFKEARASVLEPYAGATRFHNQGERVVVGQRLMQSATDFFLGWSRSDKPAFDFYVRQLRDMKASVNLDNLAVKGFTDYARCCGWAIARAHAKTGFAAGIAGYLGSGTAFEHALRRFATAYANQTEEDYAVLVKAVRAGRIKAAVTGNASGQ
jgi:uncharacterized protein (DUF2252 family)